ncbi:hypothetical protein ACFXP7_12160 [Microbacterium sp. P06]|uniref:hypothetical protein n=1 Tax=Microbacterium sp. P06 TaxID=3366949 RepID=UPI00374618DA
MDIEGMPEHERLAILDSLEARRPGAASLAGGKLAGPATPDRPDVPVWGYENYVETHPDVRLADLLRTRFPVIFHGGTDYTITSVTEDLRTEPLLPRMPVTVASEIEKWSRLHVAGIVRWDSARRAVEHLRPIDDYNAVIREWGASLLKNAPGTV